MFKASLETRHFSFEAYGRTEKSARDAMRAGLVRHAHQYGLLVSEFTKTMCPDVEVQEFEFRACYRDKHKLTAEK